MIKSVWKCMNIIAISPKSGMEQAEIIDTFWTYQCPQVEIYQKREIKCDLSPWTFVQVA